MIPVLLIICCIFAIGLFYLAHILFITKDYMNDYYKKMNEYEQLSKDLKDTNEKLASLNNDVLYRLNKNTVSLLASNFIFVMASFAKEDNMEQFTYYYNRLYFLGVPKDVLNDPNKLDEFCKNCIQLKYKVEDGQKPFEYKFTLEEE